MTEPRNQTQTSDPQVAESMATNLGTYVMDMLNAFAKGISDETAPHDLSTLEFSLLSVCLEQGECTATQLARVLPVDASRISRIVSRLFDLGLLQRRRLRDDRRVVMLSLTENGKDLITELRRRVLAFNVKLIEGVSDDEMRVFRSVAYKMLDNYASLKRLK